jgi:hypothetical protein
MKIVFLEFLYYILLIFLILSCLSFLIAFKIKINLKKRKALKNLMPEEKFLLKEIFLNAEFIPSFVSDNEFLRILEEEGIIYKKITSKSMIEYDIKDWIKKEIEKDFNILS